VKLEALRSTPRQEAGESPDRFNFLGLEVELWRIGDSPPAPKFNVVSKPNDWTRCVAYAASRVELTPSKRLQLSFWTDFRAYVELRRSSGTHRRGNPARRTLLPRSMSGGPRPSTTRHRGRNSMNGYSSDSRILTGYFETECDGLSSRLRAAHSGSSAACPLF